jgi:hypothetical protein
MHALPLRILQNIQSKEKVAHKHAPDRRAEVAVTIAGSWSCWDTIVAVDNPVIEQHKKPNMEESTGKQASRRLHILGNN